ncbi:MAG: hypothetical protein OEY47_09245, partial [Candidatus Bathyarchaeota archaeon]|nr:hypothetical protein [Candidatus Bathyarchaeota archaeon]
AASPERHFSSFSSFFTENNLAKRFIKGIVSKKLELSFGGVLENSNFYVTVLQTKTTQNTDTLNSYSFHFCTVNV